MIVALIVGALVGLSVHFALRDLNTDDVLKRIGIDKELEESLRKLSAPIDPMKIQKVQYSVYLLGFIAAAFFAFAGTFWDAIYALGVAYLIGLLMKTVIIRKGKEADRKAVMDLPMYLDAVAGLLKVGYSLENALAKSLHMSPDVARHVKPVLMKWGSGPLAAIAALEKNPLPEYQMLAAVLSQVYQGGKGALEMLENYRRQLAEVNYFKRLEAVNKKPVQNTALLMLPFAGAVIAAFYPYFINAMNMFSGFMQFR